ncbi:MAG TPA: branched-chain amino acid ABC transporter substrate-binding protein [Actinomycetota bacterium]|nr:branched-chain amino acid ABC transporter substrate-binding protein [Actinomycetota bacterium]
MSRRLHLVAAAAAMALVAAACGGGGDGGGGPAAEGPGDCTWTIATMGALSGDYASVGQPIADGVEYAVNAANEEGNLACQLEFVSEDSQGDPNPAPGLAQKIVSNQSVVFCACPYFSGETLATGKIFGKAGVAISGTGTNETIDEQGFETWFRAVAPDNIQAEVAGAYIRDGLKAKAVAVVHDNQDYSKGLAEGVAKALGDLVTDTYVINPEETDYSAVVGQVADASPDVVFYGGYTPQAGPLAKQLVDAGVDATFMTDDGSKDPAFGDTAKDAAEGALASCPCADPLKVDGAEDYVSAMQEAYGKNAPGTFAADMTDVTNLAIEALAAYEGDAEDITAVRKAVVDYFAAADGIQGITKAYAWNDDGEFEGGPGDVWIYEWDMKAKNFLSLGPASELL